MTLHQKAGVRFTLHVCLAVLGGVAFSAVCWQIANLNGRYTIAITAAIAILAVMMIGIRSLADVLVYALVLNIPLSIFGKWLFVQEVLVPAKGISIGLAEMLLVMAYTTWFVEVVIARTRPIPRLNGLDTMVALLLAVQLISLTGARNSTLALFDIVYNVKHFLIYFFLSRRLEYKHLRWVVTLMLLAILLETAIALFERVTGLVNIAQVKGDVEAAGFGTQPEVPGIEGQPRAAGTTNDSHALGLYYAMLLPVPLVMAIRDVWRPAARVIAVMIGAIGIVGLVLTLSRSGWLAFAVGSIVITAVATIVWRQWRTLLVIGAVAVTVSMLYPKTYTHLYRRIFEAPSGLMTSRWEINRTTFQMWEQRPYFGFGPGNFTEALEDPNVRRTIEGDYFLAHNALLWIAAELGLFGVLTFFGMIVVAMYRCSRSIRAPDPLVGGLALAGLAALLAYLVDGVTNPMFREAVPYAQLWLWLAIAMSLTRWSGERAAAATREPVVEPGTQ